MCFHPPFPRSPPPPRLASSLPAGCAAPAAPSSLPPPPARCTAPAAPSSLPPPPPPAPRAAPPRPALPPAECAPSDAAPAALSLLLHPPRRAASWPHQFGPRSPPPQPDHPLTAEVIDGHPRWVRLGALRPRCRSASVDSEGRARVNGLSRGEAIRGVRLRPLRGVNAVCAWTRCQGFLPRRCPAWRGCPKHRRACASGIPGDAWACGAHTGRICPWLPVRCFGAAGTAQANHADAWDGRHRRRRCTVEAGGSLWLRVGAPRVNHPMDGIRRVGKEHVLAREVCHAVFQRPMHDDAIGLMGSPLVGRQTVPRYGEPAVFECAPDCALDLLLPCGVLNHPHGERGHPARCSPPNIRRWIVSKSLAFYDACFWFGRAILPG